MRKVLIALCLAALTISIAGCSFLAKVDVGNRLADVDATLLHQPYEYVQTFTIDGTYSTLHSDGGYPSGSVSRESVVRGKVSLAAGAADVTIGADVTESTATLRREGGLDYLYEVDGVFVERIACDAACATAHFAYDTSAGGESSGFGTIPDVRYVAKDRYGFALDLGAADGLGWKVARQLAEALGFEAEAFSEETMYVVVAFGGEDGSLVRFEYTLNDFHIIRGNTAYVLDFLIATAYTVLASFTPADFSTACFPLVDGGAAGAAATAVGETVYGYVPLSSSITLRYDLTPGFYALAIDVGQGDAPMYLRILDQDGDIVAYGALTRFEIAAAGTYFLSMVCGRERGELHITLNGPDA